MEGGGRVKLWLSDKPSAERLDSDWATVFSPLADKYKNDNKYKMTAGWGGVSPQCYDMHQYGDD